MNLAQSYQAAPNELKDKVILITGAGDGIGAVAAKTYANYGATVILLGRTVSKLEKVYDEIAQQGNPQAAIYPFDFEGAKLENYEQLASTIDSEFGALHGLLHNAAILGSTTPISQFNPELWNKVMHINLNAAFLLTQACLPVLRKADAASIIFTSSGVGSQGAAYWGAYAASKAANINLMQVLSDELSENTNVKVNAIDPGVVRTAMRARAFPGEDPQTLPLADTIMPSYLYLMASQKSTITGELIKAQ
ncbi:Putative oxidoreductase [hydrothermal vent metagenome]|uniref:Oxidoreductase n=1 Tax=hydrothermal vent metagenome TaxID=652676 RepID=A0A3B1A5V2_9ZZZZ